MSAARSGWAVEVRLQARPDAIRLARRLAVPAALAAGLPPPAALNLEVALGEALINAYLHAYGERGRGTIVVTFAMEDGGLSVTVRDSGKPLATVPRIPSSVAHIAERGRGLLLIRYMVDDAEVIHPVRGGRGTAVRMRIYRPATAPEPRAGRPRQVAGTAPMSSY